MATFKTPSGALVDEETGQLIQAPPDSGASTGGAITGVDLATTPTSNFQTSITSTPTSIAGITADLPKVEPAPIEKQGDELSQRLLKINESLLGQGAFKREKETEFGVTEAQQSLDDLSTRLRDLERREKAIPIQIQQEFAGRGATQGGVAPIEAGRLRENAIEALTVSSLIDAASNRFTSAQRKVARAVEEKYGPLLEEQEIKLKNLEIIIKSPEYDRATKDRAEKQKLIEETKKNQLEAKKKEQEEIWKTAVDAAKGKADSVTLEKIRGAQTKEEALALAAPFLVKQDITATAGSIEEFKLIMKREPTSLAELNQFTASRVAAGRKEGISTSGLSPMTQSIINNPSLFDDLTPTAKGAVISQLQLQGYDTTNLGTKGLSDTAIKELAQTQKALSDLDELRKIIVGNEQLIGPITGLQRFNPYSKARKIQADVDRVRQTVGKALEGGVLRKEDEDKYKKILATLADTPDTAIYKIDALVSSIQRDIENYKGLQQAGGKSLDVKKSLQKGDAIPSQEDLRKKYNY